MMKPASQSARVALMNSRLLSGARAEAEAEGRSGHKLTLRALQARLDAVRAGLGCTVQPGAALARFGDALLRGKLVKPDKRGYQPPPLDGVDGDVLGRAGGASGRPAAPPGSGSRCAFRVALM